MSRPKDKKTDKGMEQTAPNAFIPVEISFQNEEAVIQFLIKGVVSCCNRILAKNSPAVRPEIPLHPT